MIGVRVRQPWNVVALAGAVVARSLVSIGILITIGAAASGFDLGSVLGVGYWGLWVSVICVVAGTVILVVSLRPPRTEEGGLELVAEQEQTSNGSPSLPDEAHIHDQRYAVEIAVHSVSTHSRGRDCAASHARSDYQHVRGQRHDPRSERGNAW